MITFVILFPYSHINLSNKEGRFRVLYSTRTQCRSNTPVNICVGALIIKELFQISDDEVVENLMLEPRDQYALHTTSYEEQPLSDKTLSRFRKRCYDYESAKYEGFATKKMAERIAMQSNPDDPESVLTEMAEAIPMRRLGLPTEVGELTAFLGSEESSYITGSQFVIDGGSTLPESVSVGV